MVDGTDTGDLIRGPGIYRETHFPGIAGTTAIAGHRTTYLAPFREINLLKHGNHILVNMPYAHFTYTVTGQRVVWPTDVQAAVANVGYTRLVLSACTPVFSAEKRLLVYARLTRTVPGAPRGCFPVARSRDRSKQRRTRPRRPRYQRCWYPSIRTASPRSSDSVTPGAPPRTSPIQLTCTLPSAATAACTLARSAAGAQKHSS